jgi:hypothetical protein
MNDIAMMNVNFPGRMIAIKNFSIEQALLQSVDGQIGVSD